MSDISKRGSVVVTGASSGIGMAIASELKKEGYRLALQAFRNTKILRESFDESDDLRIFEVDLLDSAQIAGFAGEVVSSMGPVYGLVNNAGEVFGAAQPDGISEADWDATFAICAKAPYLLFQALSKHFDPAGSRIVNISSISPKYGGSPTTLHYAAAKGALEATTRGLAKWGAPKGMLVNAIQPGVIDTSIHERIGRSKEALAERVKRIPLGRIGRPEEIAWMVAFLLSEKAAYITGQTFGVTGGD